MLDKVDKSECRVLLVFSSLGVGGAETALVAFLKYLKQIKDDLPVNFKFDICLTGGVKADFDNEVKSLGANLYYLNYSRRNVISFIKEYRAILAGGKYNAIHDHQDYNAGFHFLFGIGYLPPVRVVHVHNPLSLNANYLKYPLKRLTGKTGKKLLAKLTTHILGTSRQILEEYGFYTPVFRRVTLETGYCGLDVAGYRGDHAAARRSLCDEFGFAANSKILLFVGRLLTGKDPLINQKNPDFALEVAKDCIRKDSSACFLMAGGGDEGKKAKLEYKVKEWGLNDKIRLIGKRFDVPRLMLGADILLAPSFAEGLGMVIVEAQAAGLKVLASDTIPRECVIINDLVKFKALNVGPEAWANDVICFLKEPRLDSSACNNAVRKSPFAIENSAEKLVRLYTGTEKEASK